MKKLTWILAAVLLCAGCAKKVAPQPAQPTDGAEMNICVDQEGHWLSCPDEPQSKPLPQQKKADPAGGSLVLKGGSRRSELAVKGGADAGVPKVVFDGPTTVGGVKIQGNSIEQPTDDNGVTWNTNFKWKASHTLPLPPMVAPTMHDVVTHSQELSCPKGYSEKHLLLGDAIPQNWQEVFSDEYLVCVTPAFIAELKKANGDSK